ncbi:uncharacterized protein LOC119616291 [Lucilia sericata]|uniref:uncharacterized protein LOC119616291 n=1 Tax=Lucilia sericata TaxID=13632 RepID=UPI0018A813A5|nr:uncharacterized protein LOC119616291 [Lucilia sericata]
MRILKIDQFKCLIFALGLKSSKHTDIRVRLFKILNKVSETTNLDKLVDETRIMDLKSDNIMIEYQTKSIGSVNEKEHKCTKCQLEDNYCSSSKTIRTKSTQNDNKDKFQGKSKFRKHSTVTINNTIRLQIDTASDISIISFETWETIGTPDAYATKDSASDVNTNNINLLAMFECDVTINDVTKRVSCYITDIDQLNIMGIDFIQAFDLWDKPISTWCRQIKFDDEIARLKENYQPVFDNSTLGLIRNAARLEIEAGLQRLENANIISLVDTSKYAAPIVVSN